MQNYLILAYKGYMRKSERQAANRVAEQLSRSASRERMSNRNGQRNMGGQKQDQEKTESASTDTYRIGRAPSVFDKCG